MSYIIPSTQVYEQLSNPSGVQNAVPDLNACIIGPCYNVQAFDSGTASTASTSYSGHIHSAVTLTGSPLLPVLQNEEATEFKTYLPQVVVGQTVDTSSIKVWYVNPKVIPFYSVASKTSPTLGVWDRVTLNVTPSFPLTSLNASGDQVIDTGDTVVVIYDDDSQFTTKLSRIESDTVIRVIDLLPNSEDPVSVYVVKQVRTVQASNGNLNFNSIPVDSSIEIEPLASTVYGIVVDSDIHIEYRALRTDLGNRILTIADILDAEGTLGDLTDKNPLGLGVKLALANTITQVKAVAISSNDTTGYQEALELLEGDTQVYFLTPLTQEESILEIFQVHVAQMSEAKMAGWRVLLANTKIPETLTIGEENEDDPRTEAYITSSSGSYLLNDPGARFISNGVTPGDTIVILGAEPNTQAGTAVVAGVNSNQQLVITGVSSPATEVSYYVRRVLSKTAQAQHVAALSRTFGSNRVIHIQPDEVGIEIDGETKYLPGYYLCAAVAGMGAGFPVQQGFTNIGVAGIADLRKSNFYFPRAALDLMAEAGTFIFAQLAQRAIPYCRHELTTDVSVLEYRELLKVKNWDFLAYYFKSILDPFIGKWNITEDTLNTMYHTVLAGIELLKSKRSPRIGPPLLDAKITKLAPNEHNKDTVDLYMNVSIVSPVNYINLYLVI